MSVCLAGAIRASPGRITDSCTAGAGNAAASSRSAATRTRYAPLAQDLHRGRRQPRAELGKHRLAKVDEHPPQHSGSHPVPTRGDGGQRRLQRGDQLRARVPAPTATTVNRSRHSSSSAPPTFPFLPIRCRCSA